MADKRDQWADSFSAEPQGGWLTGFLAEETKGTRRLMWRLGSWGVAAVGAVTLAVLANQYELQSRRDHFAAADAISRQEQQLQRLTKEAQAENRRLSQAIDTLNNDRDRLFTRVTSVEKGLESATGSILARQTLPSLPPREPPPQIAAPASQPAPSPSIVAEPKAASVLSDLPSVPTKPLDSPAPETTAKLGTEQWLPKSDNTSEPSPASNASAEPQPAVKAAEPVPLLQLAAVAPAPADVATPVARTEFGVDIGTANSLDGLRALWRGLSKTPALTGLRPIIVVRERSNGLGMQLRLVAGPLTDAAAAARICATLAEGKRSCETSVFDGQRLALKEDVAPAQPPAAATPVAPKPRPAPHRRAAPTPEPTPAPKPPEQRSEQPAPKPVEEAQAEAPKPKPSLSTILGFSRE
jgi:outer membrane biosynthesis protein TonB